MLVCSFSSPLHRNLGTHHTKHDRPSSQPPPQARHTILLACFHSFVTFTSAFTPLLRPLSLHASTPPILLRFDFCLFAPAYSSILTTLNDHTPLRTSHFAHLLSFSVNLVFVLSQLSSLHDHPTSPPSSTHHSTSLSCYSTRSPHNSCYLLLIFFSIHANLFESSLTQQLHVTLTVLNSDFIVALNIHNQHK